MAAFTHNDSTPPVPRLVPNYRSASSARAIRMNPRSLVVPTATTSWSGRTWFVITTRVPGSTPKSSMSTTTRFRVRFRSTRSWIEDSPVQAFRSMMWVASWSFGPRRNLTRKTMLLRRFAHVALMPTVRRSLMRFRSPTVRCSCKLKQMSMSSRHQVDGLLPGRTNLVLPMPRYA